jgi:hypothetical protein
MNIIDSIIETIRSFIFLMIAIVLGILVNWLCFFIVIGIGWAVERQKKKDKFRKEYIQAIKGSYEKLGVNENVLYK